MYSQLETNVFFFIFVTLTLLVTGFSKLLMREVFFPVKILMELNLGKPCDNKETAGSTHWLQCCCSLSEQ
jgi:hypothetical protein